MNHDFPHPSELRLRRLTSHENDRAIDGDTALELRLIADTSKQLTLAVKKTFRRRSRGNSAEVNRTHEAAQKRNKSAKEDQVLCLEEKVQGGIETVRRERRH